MNEDRFNGNSILKVQSISPSNIALIKYWGKYGDQLPINPSLSLTLTHSTIKMNLELFESKFSLKEKVEERVVVYSNGREEKNFGLRIGSFLERHRDLFFPTHFSYSIRIATESTFPHSAGVASSAAAMAALAQNLVAIQEYFHLQENENRVERTSEIARLASGSACRSLYSEAALWGKTELFSGSSDHYAISVEWEKSVSPFFKKMDDTILIVESAVKKVSSSVGHGMMKDHPFKEARIQSANSNLKELWKGLQSGDQEVVAKVIEREALTLHGLMMSSYNSYLLLHPSTLLIIEKIREWRAKSGVFITFTLDAGPNVHCLYSVNNREEIRKFILEELAPYCQMTDTSSTQKNIIFDEMGKVEIAKSKSLKSL